MTALVKGAGFFMADLLMGTTHVEKDVFVI